MELYSHQYNPILEYFQHSKKIHCIFPSHPTFLSLVPGNHLLYVLLIENSYKLNHKIWGIFFCVCAWIIFHCIMLLRVIHMGDISTFLLFIAEQYSTVWICHIVLFIHWLIRHLVVFSFGVLCICVAINITYMSLCGHVSSFLLVRVPGVILLGHVVNLHISLRKNAKLFYKGTIPFYFLSCNVSLPIDITFCLFKYSQSSGCEVVCHYALNCIL